MTRPADELLPWNGPYTGHETFQLMVKKELLRGVVEEWAERNLACDLRIRRARTPGYGVLETKDLMFARSVLLYYGAERVAIRK